MFKVIKQYLKATDWLYLLACLFCSVLSVLTLVSLGMNAGGFEVNAFDGSIEGLGAYRNAVVQGGASLLGIICAVGLSCIDYRSLVRIWPIHVCFSWLLVLISAMQ